MPRLTDAELREHRECLGFMITHLERMLAFGGGDTRLIEFALAEARRQFQRPGNGELLARVYDRLTGVS
jgi:hypothetical protein